MYDLLQAVRSTVFCKLYNCGSAQMLRYIYNGSHDHCREMPSPITTTDAIGSGFGCDLSQPCSVEVDPTGGTKDILMHPHYPGSYDTEGQ